MRLSEDRIEQGLLHPNKDVRFACLQYFADSFSRNQTVMPVVIEALERFGRANAFPYNYLIAALAQTEATIRWIIGELNNQPRRTEPERHYLETLSRLLCRADSQLLLAHEKSVLSSPGFSPVLIKPFTYRLKLLTWDSDARWRELEIICEEGKDEVYTKDMGYDEAEQIVEALAREGECHADRMMSLLRVKIEEYEHNPMKWMESLMVRLAGELRYEPAIPLLVGKLHEEGELSSEECHNALTRIGTDGVVQALRQDYPSAEWHFRLYASGVLGLIHTDLAVEVGIELLKEEEDLELQDGLAQSLAKQFSYEGIEVAYEVLLGDLDLFDLQCALVPACTLLGQSYPELDQWRKEIEAAMQPKPISHGSRPQPPAPLPPPPRMIPVSVEKKAGRNDPCPCGSGKKYKKCCMTK